MTQEEQIRLYRLMEKLNWFFHQEMHYLNRDIAEKTARECYPEIRDFTYDIAGSSFDLIEDSTWLKSLPVREDFDKGIYQHYRLFTYDDVYDIIAVSYEFVAKL